MRKARRTVAASTLAVAITVLGSAELGAQGFDSGSTGADGALTIAPFLGTVVFDPTSFDPPLDADGDNVYHFTTITIGRNTVLRLGADVLGEGRPVVWLASGAVQIDGTIDLNGSNGHGAGNPALPSIAGAGGFNGGVGGTAGSPARAGSGPGGGSTGAGERGGHGGHFRAGGNEAGRATGGAAYGNAFLFPLLGGSGAGGAAFIPGDPGSGGGAGGGAILIASSISIELGTSSRIEARGGSDGGAFAPALRGGRGSGGSVRLMAPVVRGNGRIDVTSPASGATPSPGRIRVESFLNSFTGVLTPLTSATFASPLHVFPPPTAPRVRVTRVAAIDLPATPTASFENPDVSIDTAGGVSIEIEAANIPPGTQIRLSLIPESGESITIVSEPLAGTLASSTASAGPVVFPSGFTRVFVTATWSP